MGNNYALALCFAYYNFCRIHKNDSLHTCNGSGVDENYLDFERYSKYKFIKYADKLKSYVGSRGYYLEGGDDTPYCIFRLESDPAYKDMIKEVGDDYVIIHDQHYEGCKSEILIPLSLFVLEMEKVKS